LNTAAASKRLHGGRQTVRNALNHDVNLDHLASIPPRQRKNHLNGDWHPTIKLYRSAKFVRLWIPIYMIPFCAALAHYIATDAASESLGSLAIATFFSVGLVAGLVEEFTLTNVGLYLRRVEPIRYWLVIAWCSAGTALPLAVALLK
jgi:hypothetical protein